MSQLHEQKKSSEAKQSLVFPTILKAGGTVGVLPFASPIDSARLQRGIDALKSLGFLVKNPLPADSFTTKEYSLFGCADVKERVDAFHAFLKDPAITLILATRGGYGCMELLERIDWNLVRTARKAIVGFSDLTALLCSVYQKSALSCVHGPMLGSGFASEDPAAIESSTKLRALLEGRAVESLSFKISPLQASSSEIRGPLLAGNLCMFASLLGTPYAPHFDDHIVFIEEVGERLYRTHRMLMQLKLSGAFRKVRAIVFGDILTPKDDPDLTRINENEVIKDIFQGSDTPIFLNAPIGHAARNFPIPLGAQGQIDPDGTFHLLNEIVS